MFSPLAGLGRKESKPWQKWLLRSLSLQPQHVVLWLTRNGPLKGDLSNSSQYHQDPRWTRLTDQSWNNSMPRTKVRWTCWLKSFRKLLV
ncbi:hypothetical protein BDV10DRAFT_160954 [Aspergillus recurvatus]